MAKVVSLVRRVVSAVVALVKRAVGHKTCSSAGKCSSKKSASSKKVAKKSAKVVPLRKPTR